jgi:hypothetical protein
VRRVPHSPLLDALGTATLIAYLGFLGGYVGTVLRMAATRGGWVEDPLWVGQHASAVAGLIAALTLAVTSL